MSFETTLEQRIADVEQIIYAYLPGAEGQWGEVLSAMNYSFRAGGKRLRPMLMQEIYNLCGGKEPIIEPFMAAIEMIHTYSLIHDDLPAMDNDDYRRGQQTAHVVYGEDIAILAGDGLLNLAFETAMQAYDLASYRKGRGEDDNAFASNDGRIAKSLRILAAKSGVEGMIGGQTIDVTYEGKAMSEELLLTMYRLKTGALLEASMCVGAVLAGADAALVSEIEQAAGEIGLAFQIQDDILDVAGDEGTLGKPVNSDQKNHKTTYVTLHSLEESAEKVDQLTRSALERLSPIAGEGSFLSDLLIWLIHRDR